MRVLLINVDSKIINLALGKLSTYHKCRGDFVRYEELNLFGYHRKGKGYTSLLDCSEYDKVYISNIFTVNQECLEATRCNQVLIGGIGSVNPHDCLPEEVDTCEVDYSLSLEDISYGFITRGCIRKCSFCLVPEIEGNLYFYNDIDKIIRHDRVSFLDNNFLAYSGHKEILKRLIVLNIKCDFNQGLDIRLIDEENAELLSRLNYAGEYVFAFDDIKLKKIIEKKLEIVKRYIARDWGIKFFIYHNAVNMSLKETVFRTKWCKKNKCLPYLMRDINCYESENREFLVDLAAYCNQPGIFKKMNFDAFLDRRHKNLSRISVSKEKYRVSSDGS